MFVWREDMSVGNAKIDNDHKYLISIINTIEAALNCEAPVKVLMVYVSELIDFGKEHFEREELYQEEINFPHQGTHEIYHKGLTERIEMIRKNLMSQADSEAYQFTTPRLVKILRDWLVDHFQHEDMKMKEYFNALK